MKNWQVSYKSGAREVVKYYASMNTATQAVERLAQKGITASYCPVWQGGNTI